MNKKQCAVILMVVLFLMTLTQGCSPSEIQENTSTMTPTESVPIETEKTKDSFLKQAETTDEDISIKIEDLDCNIDFVTENNFRYPKFWFTNNSEYTITSFSLKMHLKLGSETKTITAHYLESVSPGETSEKEQIYGRNWKEYAESDLEKLEMQFLTLEYEDKEGKECSISYDFELEKYSVN